MSSTNEDSLGPFDLSDGIVYNVPTLEQILQPGFISTILLGKSWVSNCRTRIIDTQGKAWPPRTAATPMSVASPWVLATSSKRGRDFFRRVNQEAVNKHRGIPDGADLIKLHKSENHKGIDISIMLDIMGAVSLVATVYYRLDKTSDRPDRITTRIPVAYVLANHSNASRPPNNDVATATINNLLDNDKDLPSNLFGDSNFTFDNYTHSMNEMCDLASMLSDTYSERVGDREQVVISAAMNKITSETDNATSKQLSISKQNARSQDIQRVTSSVLSNIAKAVNGCFAALYSLELIDDGTTMAQRLGYYVGRRAGLRASLPPRVYGRCPNLEEFCSPGSISHKRVSPATDTIAKRFESSHLNMKIARGIYGKLLDCKRLNYIFSTRDGRVFYLLVSIPESDAWGVQDKTVSSRISGFFYVAVHSLARFFDDIKSIEEKAELVRDLKEKNSDLRNREKAIDELMSQMTHLVTRPAYEAKIATGNLAKKLAGLPSDPDLEYRLKKIDKCIFELTASVTKFKGMARNFDDIQSVRTAELPYSFGSLLDDVLQKMQILAALENISMIVRKSGSTVSLNSLATRFSDYTITLPRDLLEEVMENLVHNAIKYTIGNDPVLIDIDRQGRHLLFVIQNSGSEILEEEEKLVFQREKRAKSTSIYNVEGTGIGLYLAAIGSEALGCDLNLLPRVALAPVETEDFGTLRRQRVTFELKIPI